MASLHRVGRRVFDVFNAFPTPGVVLLQGVYVCDTRCWGRSGPLLGRRSRLSGEEI